MKERANVYSLELSEEEALGLLEIAMLWPSDMTGAQREAFIKLSDYCRQFLREDGDFTLERGRATAPVLAGLYAA